ncbi:MAG: hypothetical protein IIC71_10195 [Acidobacteria bacterium]|nr:hypothetical protein [Acidobacteriota bacterium]
MSSQNQLHTHARPCSADGASTTKRAVNQLIDADLRRRHLLRLETGEGIDLSDDERMRGAWVS